MSLCPTSTQYLVGALIYARNNIVLRTEEKNKQKAPKNRCFNFILGSLKSQNFDV